VYIPAEASGCSFDEGAAHSPLSLQTKGHPFPVMAGPRLWNSLPSNLRQSDLTHHQFRRALKTYLFGWLRLQHLVTCF